MNFLITYADGTTETREMSDCNTVEDALNTVAGSAPGVKVSVNEVEPPKVVPVA